VKGTEQDILALTAHPSPEHDRLRRLALDERTDTERLIATAVKEGLVCLLHENLRAAGVLQAFSREQRQRLRRLYLGTAGFNISLIDDLTRILDRTGREEISLVLLQGIPLLYQIYDDPGLRPMTDIDLWVLPPQFHRLARVLSDLGYRGDPLYPHTFRKSNTTLDVHTHILGGDRVRTRRWILAGGQARLYAATRPLYIEGRKALCLAPPDQVLYLGLHALKHNVNRLIWLADIRLLVSSWSPGDWREFTNRVEEMGVVRSMACIFFLLRQLLEFSPPRNVRSFFRETRIPFHIQKILRRRKERGALPAWAPFFLFAPEKGGVKRLVFLAETLFPGKTVLRQASPWSRDLKAGEHYLMRILQI